MKLIHTQITTQFLKIFTLTLSEVCFVYLIYYFTLSPHAIIKRCNVKKNKIFQFCQKLIQHSYHLFLIATMLKDKLRTGSYLLSTTENSHFLRSLPCFHIFKWPFITIWLPNSLEYFLVSVYLQKPELPFILSAL